MVINKITSISRNAKIGILFLSDAFSLIVGILLSFSLRLGYLYFPSGFLENKIFWLIFISPLIGIPIFIYFGLYREVIRYLSTKTIWPILKAVGLYSILWALVVMLAKTPEFPRSLVFINFMVTFIVIAGSRMLAKIMLSQVDSHNKKNDIVHKKVTKVLIYGAGSVGRQLAFGLNQSNHYEMCGFVDDDDSIQGRNLLGYPVISIGEIEKFTNSNDVTDIFLVMPSISRKKRNQILETLLPLRLRIKTLSGISQFTNGGSSIDEIKDLDIDDLLMRESVVSDDEPLISITKDKVVMVTGAGGSIGSEICRQVIKRNPKILLLVEISEYSLYEIHHELEAICSSLKVKDKLFNLPKIIPLLGSVQDKLRMSEILKTWRPNILYHAAAYKHVPMVESNLSEGIKNNIFGTYTLSMAAIEHKIDNFVLISTDKAVNPTNSMGASKRVAELILQALSNETDLIFDQVNNETFENNTQFSMVRFGNVLGSSGSVVPLFRRQIQQGGPITLTHKDITRFFMTVSEASQLVMQTAAMKGKNKNASQVYVLDMGKPVKIINLAKRMVELSGLRIKDKDFPQGEIEIQITGLRKGEKLYEELLIGNNPIKTSNPKILKASEEFFKWAILEKKIQNLSDALNENDPELIIHILSDLVTGFTPEKRISDYVYLERKN
ncbi:polysaccharide biosynthesis protein [Candidatus Pseudothioglobus singularis]|nr:polysaccharide biosynthesis protein [Candidatus Pseudothioglobus singularis]